MDARLIFASEFSSSSSIDFLSVLTARSLIDHCFLNFELDAINEGWYFLGYMAWYGCSMFSDYDFINLDFLVIP